MSMLLSLAASEHAVGIGRLRGIRDRLDHIPMFDQKTILAKAVHVDNGNAAIIGVIIVEAVEIHMRPDLVTDGDDLVNDNVLLREQQLRIGKEISQCLRTICQHRIVLNVIWVNVFVGSDLGNALSDQEVVEVDSLGSVFLSGVCFGEDDNVHVRLVA